MVSACATDPIQLPDFEVAARSSEEVTSPIELPPLCEIPWVSVECWQELDVFEDIAIDNTTIASLNADIAREGEQAYDYILAGAIKQQSIALIREEMLEAERRDHTVDNLWHRGLIILMAAGMIL